MWVGGSVGIFPYTIFTVPAVSLVVEFLKSVDLKGDVTLFFDTPV